MSSLHPGSSPERVLRTYFHAKDGNRPHLMSGVFSESVILEMIVKTGTIAFPPVTEGLAAVTDVLVRRFAQTCENIYDRLVVTIEAMEVLDPRELRPVMAWLAALPYPWCPAARIVSSAPPISALEPVLQHVGRNGNH